MVELADSLYRPRSVVIVGGSRDAAKLAGKPLTNLRRAGFPGRIHVVNPGGGAMPGADVVTDVASIPGPVDLAISLVPAAAAVGAIAPLAEIGVKAVVVAASGFSEAGPAGGRLEEELVAEAELTGVRLVGPNCNGLYSVHGRLPLGYNRAHGLALVPGDIAVVSQSGAMLGALVDGVARSGGRLHSFVSTGNEADLGVCDFFELALGEPDVRVVALVIDRVGDGPRFRRLLAEARHRGKDVVVLKFGNTTAGQEASRSHSARMAGDQHVYKVMLREAGAHLCSALPELTATAALLARGVRDRDGVLGFSTSGAGGAMLADALDGVGVQLTALDDDVKARLVATLRFVEPNNPIDLGAGSSINAQANFSALQALGRERLNILFLTPPPTAQAAAAYVEAFSSFADAVGGGAIAVVSDRVDDAEVGRWAASGIPVVSTPAEAARVAAHLCRTTPPPAPSLSTDPQRILGEAEATETLQAFGVPFPRLAVIGAASAAAEAAERIGFPLVLKAVVPGLNHKSALGLVHTGLASASAVEAVASQLRQRLAELRFADAQLLLAEQVEAGTDIIVSVRRDPEFGPLAVLGLGGTATEQLGRFEVVLDAEASAVERALRACAAVGPESPAAPAVITQVTALVQRLFEVLDARSDVETIELNPVRARPDGGTLVALDALIVLAERD